MLPLNKVSNRSKASVGMTMYDDDDDLYSTGIHDTIQRTQHKAGPCSQEFIICYLTKGNWKE